MNFYFFQFYKVILYINIFIYQKVDCTVSIQDDCAYKFGFEILIAPFDWSIQCIEQIYFNV